MIIGAFSIRRRIKQVDQYSEQRAADRNQDDGEPERQLETDDDGNRRERGHRQNIAMREIDHAHDAEDEVEPARHQRVDAAEQYSADEEFRQRHEATSGALQIGSLREGRIVCGHPGRSPDIDFLPLDRRSLLSRQLLRTLLGVKARVIDALPDTSIFVRTNLRGVFDG